MKNTEGAGEFTTLSVYCLTVGKSQDAQVEVMLGEDTVVHTYTCQIVPVILCPGYLESFPCAMTVRTECVKGPSGDTEVLFYIDYSSFSKFHSSTRLCSCSFHPLNLKCPTSTKLESKHCSPFIVSNESH